MPTKKLLEYLENVSTKSSTGRIAAVSLHAKQEEDKEEFCRFMNYFRDLDRFIICFLTSGVAHIFYFIIIIFLLFCYFIRKLSFSNFPNQSGRSWRSLRIWNERPLPPPSFFL